MKCSNRSFAIVFALIVALLSLRTETLNARDLDRAPLTVGGSDR